VIARATLVATATSLAALFFSHASAVAEPVAPIPPADPGATNTAAEDSQRDEERPAEKADCPWCEVVKAAQQLPPPDLSGVPPLVDVSVPVGFGLGLPDVVPDIAFPIQLPAPQLPPPPKLKFQPPPAPKLPPPPKIGPPKWPF
jgi:hypothetical protein